MDVETIVCVVGMCVPLALCQVSSFTSTLTLELLSRLCRVSGHLNPDWIRIQSGLADPGTKQDLVNFVSDTLMFHPYFDVFTYNGGKGTCGVKMKQAFRT